MLFNVKESYMIHIKPEKILNLPAKTEKTEKTEKNATKYIKTFTLSVLTISIVFLRKLKMNSTKTAIEGGNENIEIRVQISKPDYIKTKGQFSICLSVPDLKQICFYKIPVKNVKQEFILGELDIPFLNSLIKKSLLLQVCITNTNMHSLEAESMNLLHSKLDKLLLK